MRREANYLHGSDPPALTFMDDEPLVSLAEPGSYYQMEYIVGGGGGHSITAVDWAGGPWILGKSWKEILGN